MKFSEALILELVERINRLEDENRRLIEELKEGENDSEPDKI